MRDIKQKSRNEIKENHINKLQEKYNILYQDFKELLNKYNDLVHFSINIAFAEYNDDVELLLRCLNRQGLVQRVENTYINPYNDINYMQQKNIKRTYNIYDNPDLLEKGAEE